MNREPAGPNPDEVAHDSVPVIKRECSDDLDMSSHDSGPTFKRESSDDLKIPSSYNRLPIYPRRHRDKPGVPSLDRLGVVQEPSAETSWASVPTFKRERSDDLDIPSHDFHHAFKRESHTPPLQGRLGTLLNRLGMPVSPMLLRRQRSWSQVVQANSGLYRPLHMADANVFVEHLPEVPATIDQKLGSIFGRVAWALGEQEENEELGRWYCQNSRALAKKIAGQFEWSELLQQLLNPLKERDPEMLADSVSVLSWVSALCPSGQDPPKEPDFEMLADHVSVRSWISALCPSGQGPPRSSRRESLNGLSEPRPNITLGLPDTAFPLWQRTLLWRMQDENYLISDPHDLQMGVRFPFLVIECRTGTTGRALIEGQNQAAVAGACALNILEDLQVLAGHNPNYPRIQQGPVVLFSVTTEGPLHEIWVHYRVGAEYHMTCHGAWRTTFPEHARKFVEALARIVEWGRTGFRESVLDLLGPLGVGMDEDD